MKIKEKFFISREKGGDWAKKERGRAWDPKKKEELEGVLSLWDRICTFREKRERRDSQPKGTGEGERAGQRRGWNLWDLHKI